MAGYGVPEEGSLFPLDGISTLPKDSYSHGLRERLSFDVASGSFNEPVCARNTTGGQVLKSKRQAEEVAAKVSQDFEAFYQYRGSQGPEETWTPW